MSPKDEKGNDVEAHECSLARFNVLNLQPVLMISYNCVLVTPLYSSPTVLNMLHTHAVQSTVARHFVAD
jgi:hypothetical protein